MLVFSALLENTKIILHEWIQSAVMQSFNLGRILSQFWRVMYSHLTHLCTRKQNICVRSLLMLSDPPTAVRWEQRWVRGLRLALQGDILSVRPRVCLLPLTPQQAAQREATLLLQPLTPSDDSSSTLQLHSSFYGRIIGNELPLINTVNELSVSICGGAVTLETVWQIFKLNSLVN